MGLLRKTRYQKVIVARGHKPPWILAHAVMLMWLSLIVLVVLALIL
jgi:hypothetical protein